MGGEKFRGEVEDSGGGDVCDVDEFDGAGGRRAARDFARWESYRGGASVRDCFGAGGVSARGFGCDGRAINRAPKCAASHERGFLFVWLAFPLVRPCPPLTGRARLRNLFSRLGP